MSVMGKDALITLASHDMTPLQYHTSTSGYVAAFGMTCKKLDMEWLLVYRNKLPCYDSDLFDEEIANEVIKCFDKPDENANSYYRYLIQKSYDRFDVTLR